VGRSGVDRLESSLKSRGREEVVAGRDQELIAGLDPPGSHSRGGRTPSESFPFVFGGDIECALLCERKTLDECARWLVDME
jgi:hypothetical protein